MNIQQKIDQFLSSTSFAVAGASANRGKFGNKLVRCYQQNNRSVIPVNPVEKEIEGLPVCSSVAVLPDGIGSLSIVTPPQVTVKLVQEAIARGITNIWMQPGAEHPDAEALCKQHGINLIADGSCLLVVLGYHDH